MHKILIAEDDPFLSKIYNNKFTNAGFSVKLALNGAEIAKDIDEFGPEVLLLDLIMPEKDGFQVLQELKASEKWKNLPVIVTTNLSQTEDKDRATSLGATDYIVKGDTPINVIVDRVNAAIGPSKA